jgi:hypothetical protein
MRPVTHFVFLKPFNVIAILEKPESGIYFHQIGQYMHCAIDAYV